MEIKEIIVFVFQAIVVLTCCGCLFAFSWCLYLAIRGDSPILLSLNSDADFNWKQKVFLFAAVAVLFVSIYQGGRAMVFWIPSEWGSIDEDGEFTAHRDGFAITFASIAGIALTHFIVSALPHKVASRVASYEIDWMKRIYEEESPAYLKQLASELQEQIEARRDTINRSSTSELVSEDGLMLQLFWRMNTLVTARISKFERPSPKA